MDECGSAAAGQAAAAGWESLTTTSERQRVYYRHRDGRNTLMPLFTSVSPVRAASLPEPLTAAVQYLYALYSCTALQYLY